MDDVFNLNFDLSRVITSGATVLVIAVVAWLLARFASRIVRVVYALDSADAVILDVPFRPAVIDAINAKAAAERISPEAWVANAISRDLKTTQ